MKKEYTVTIESNETKNSNELKINSTKVDILPPPGRPRIYDGKYHNYAARLRSDVFDYIKTQIGEDKQYRSINEFLNALVLDHMKRGEQ